MPHFRSVAPSTALFAHLILSGCVGDTLLNTIPDDFRLDANSRTGLVIGSVGSKPDLWHEYSRYDFRSLSDAQVQGFFVSGSKTNSLYMFGSMPLCDDDGLQGECGHLFAIALPAGDYEISWVIPAMDSYATTNFATQFYRQQLIDYRFSIYPGEATYIGNLLSRICIGASSTVTHGHRVWSAIGDVADLSARDIPLLEKKYPLLAGASIRHETMQGKPWLWQYKPELWFGVNPDPPYGWPPECDLAAEKLETYLRGPDDPAPERN